ncbi:MAG: hypothetical protein K8T89_17290 [Planctomycetes bacterium]|nr:hypothetical protein [Planctomycetota bacterium]
MSRDLLSTWLEVPSNPWPPEHHALLGLSAGQGTSEEIELRVLERMEKLRQHQLLHPELVTEGMNLLAQAMIALADSSNRRDADDAIPISPIIEIPPARTWKPAPRVVEELPRLPSEPIPDFIIPELAEEQPLTLPEEDLEEDDEFDVLDDDEPEEKPIPKLSLPPLLDQISTSVPKNNRPPRSRREIYKELARIRKVLRVWDRLRVYLEDPLKTFTRRTETVAFMGLLTELRPLLPLVSDLIGGTNQPGNIVAALARQQLIVEMFRSLLPSQCDALARDCRQAHYVMTEHYQNRRRYLRNTSEKNFARLYWYPLVRRVSRQPEWAFLALGVLSLVIAFVRSVPR